MHSELETEQQQEVQRDPNQEKTLKTYAHVSYLFNGKTKHKAIPQETARAEKFTVHSTITFREQTFKTKEDLIDFPVPWETKLAWTNRGFTLAQQQVAREAAENDDPKYVNLGEVNIMDLVMRPKQKGKRTPASAELKMRRAAREMEEKHPEAVDKVITDLLKGLSSAKRAEIIAQFQGANLVPGE
jgi:molecular chaperone GrpE (heat shock protein)